jgi:hypothetical protein
MVDWLGVDKCLTTGQVLLLRECLLPSLLDLAVSSCAPASARPSHSCSGVVPTKFSEKTMEAVQRKKQIPCLKTSQNGQNQMVL